MIESSTQNEEVTTLGKFEGLTDNEWAQCKTFIFWKQDEWIFDRKQIQTLHENISGSELIIYAHCSHLLWVDQWDKFVTKTIEFLTLKAHR